MKMILCADIWKLFKYKNDDYAFGGSYIPLEIHHNKRKWTETDIRKELKKSIEARVLLRDNEEINENYIICNLTELLKKING